MKLPKKFRPLIAALGALIVIGVAYLLIITLTPPPPEKEEEVVLARQLESLVAVFFF